MCTESRFRWRIRMPMLRRVALDLDLLLTVAGGVGAVLTLVSFAAVSTGRTTPGSLTYSLMNVAGGGALFASAAAQGAWPSAVVNVVWVAIGAVAIGRWARSRAEAGRAPAAPVRAAREWVAGHTGEFRMPQHTGEFPAASR